ncbi:MAG: TGS domain-containing protein [Candidatus Diapherotrites archaeon]
MKGSGLYLTEDELFREFDKDAAKIIEVLEFSKKNSKRTRFLHQLRTAKIVFDLSLDQKSISAALLHELKDCINLAPVDEDVREIVMEVNKIYEAKERNIEHLNSVGLANILLAISKDLRSIIVELASHLDEMRQIYKTSKKPSVRELRAAKLSLEVYSNICQKLGLVEMCKELQDLGMAILMPKEYKKTKALIYEKIVCGEKVLAKAKCDIEKLVSMFGIKALVQGRVKGVYSIYRKSIEENLEIDKIKDIIGVRVVCDSVEDCYKVLNIIKQNFGIHGKIYDYIKKPKENNYQSIHVMTKVSNIPVEVQIRTVHMHREAEYGAAAHWRYKRGEQYTNFDGALLAARKLFELQQKDMKGLLNYVKFKLTDNTIFVLTPKHDIIALPKKATVLDFAYAVHTDLGNRFKFANVNGVRRPANYVLESGDKIRVFVDTKKTVKASWLNFARTSKARSAIRKELESTKGFRVFNPNKANRSDIIFAKCCNPLPGDDVVAYKTSRDKITVHRTDCRLLFCLPKKKKFLIATHLLEMNRYVIRIEIKAFESGVLLRDLLEELKKMDAKIVRSELMVESGNIVKGLFDLYIKDRTHLEQIIENLQKIQNIIYVKRV